MPIDELVHQLHDGRVEPYDLSPELRRDCVARLTADGYTSSQIASLMRITERTVRRDRAAARKQRSIQPSDTLGDELLGDSTPRCARQDGRRNAPNLQPLLRRCR
jgi:hypothetical protein